MSSAVVDNCNSTIYKIKLTPNAIKLATNVDANKTMSFVYTKYIATRLAIKDIAANVDVARFNTKRFLNKAICFKYLLVALMRHDYQLKRRYLIIGYLSVCFFLQLPEGAGG